KEEMFRLDRRHINTKSDSEVLLNVLAHELQAAAHGYELDVDSIFNAVAGVHRRCRGAYAVVVLIAGYGLLAFRDPYGIRPLVYGKNETEAGPEFLIASESVALDTLGFEMVRDIEPGEAVFIDLNHNLHSRQCAQQPIYSPCIFEYVYLARPDSVIDGVSVYESRLKMGEFLAEKVRRIIPVDEIDVVIPIPDSSRPAAMQLAQVLGIPYREGFVKNRYVGRTFIMPGQSMRRKSVRQKLNTCGQEFKGKKVLLVDDSIVRGTTSREIVDMARAAGAQKVYFASAAPPVRFPNVYGIDMPTRGELIATGRTDAGIAAEIGADALVYQDIAALKQSVTAINPALTEFDASCFDGCYITGDVDEHYLDAVENRRGGGRSGKSDEDGDGKASQQLVLQLAAGAQD
ncbi:MAG: amidophosphoribosyltransferase, partial [Betaproteobacteria bacterium]|nr:amidophosphoribosyltransferase [Betaproteobacteria bacterium]